MNYKRLNTVTGWLVFAIAAFTYIITVEPTASLWDCGEFILSAYKLEVGHSPGAPLFAILGHLFTMFASPENVAFMANIFSALCSAFTILFLFWSITHLARRFVDNNTPELSLSETVTIMSCGIVGSLVYTFSDTFWFSAVEGEVYAASSLITAVVFWAILKWEEQADSKYSNRWLLLIAYVTGLSIGVHLLNLLVVPAIVFVYYFKKYEITRKGIIYTSVIAIVLLALLVWGIIPLTPVVASWFEIVFVNTFGLPVNSGVLFFVAVLTAILSYAIHYTYEKKNVILNTVFLCLSLCLLGFGSYAMIIIRSSANTPMNQNRPDNIFALIKYLNRDQYGSNPLITGPYFTNAGDYNVEDKETYVLLGDKYVKKGIDRKRKYNKTTFFPRMWSNAKQEHVNVYKTYVKGKNPTFADNLHFFFDYQIGFMYWRYFMWNFVGRQNDIQASRDDVTRGNWMSGLKFIDEARLGPVDNLPKYLAENKGVNKYYFIPLLLGLLGILYQLKRDKKGFTVVALLFFFTGIAIIIYLNQTPEEPRERDYAYAGSFYVFAIWIGLGIAFIHNILAKVLKRNIAAPVALILGLPAPVIMAQQNWDDHDRSGRYIATDFGYNYLISCDKNAVVYTYGDNDTFTLWYNQEVENVRTDVKASNISYLTADWYYIQMMKRTYDAPPLATTATPEKIIGNTRDAVYIVEQRPNLNVKSALEYIFSDDKKTKKTLQSGENIDVAPTKNYVLPIDREEVIRLGLAKDTSAIVPALNFSISGNWLVKNSLAALDFAANNFLKRPIYYGITVGADFYTGINNNLRQEGFALKLVPENTNNKPMDVDKTFDLLMNKFRYRGLNDADVYMDETARRMLSSLRNTFLQLINILKISGDKGRVKQLMEKYHEVLPEMERGVSSILQTPYIHLSNPLVENYFYSGLDEYGVSLAQRLIDEYRKEFNYYFKLQTKMSAELGLRYSYHGAKDLLNILKKYNQPDLQKRAEELFSEMEKSV
ncbi:MAG: DUF2723 domain-containing protein [Prevotellaceae bacterium]|jgi:hypothetical protein|nr:DUF2723 domain-containing protein [Prevotellaceae bacterium]